NGSDELVDREIDVGVRGQLATLAGPEEGGAVAVALTGDELGLEAGRDGRVVLCLTGQGPEDGAFVGLAQERGELAELVTQVGTEVAVVGQSEILGRVGGERIEQDVNLGGPPA